MVGMMKCVRVLLPLGIGMMLAGCQVSPMVDTPDETETGGVATAEKPLGYVALPGRAATSQTPSDTDAAFEAAAAMLKAAPRRRVPQDESPVEPEPVNVDPVAVQQAATSADTRPSPVVVTPPEPEPAPVVVTPPAPEPSPAAAYAAPRAEAAAVAPAVQPQPMGEAAGYALQITNGTLGRLYVEVQDDGGNIFPFGFMYSHQRLCSQPQEAKPIQGALNVVIRDPDSPGAPEVRRYQVAPPPDYMGKTLSVTILPGRYRAAVDGKVYYTSPLPEETTPETAEEKPTGAAR